MNNPKISIITITYNSEKTLEQTIQSVISQNYDNLEYLIIDGGSTDHTLDIVNKYRNNIAVMVSEPDNGISDAFNKGIERATGEIIGIINSDDLLCPNALSAVAAAYEATVDVYRGNTQYWDEQNGITYRGIPSMEFPANHILPKSVCHQSTFVTKAAYTKCGGFRTDFRYSMDYDLLVRFYQKSTKWKYINIDLAISRMGGVTDQTSFWKKRKEVYSIVVANGGSKWYAYGNELYFLWYQTFKKILFLFGRNRIQRLKYGKGMQL